jgi:hypothetical protein
MKFTNNSAQVFSLGSVSRAISTLVSAIIGLGILSSGCQGESGSELRITPTSLEVLRIGITAEASPAKAGMDACRTVSGAAILIEEVGTGQAQPGEFDLLISLGLPPSGVESAVALAEEEIILVAPEGVEAGGNLTTSSLLAIFSGQARRWSDLPDGSSIGSGEIALWNYPQGHPLRTVFESVLEDLPAGRSSFASLAPTPREMSEAVASEPGRIGYIPAAWLHPGLQRIEIEGGLQQQLRLPLLASTTNGFGGMLDRIVRCLQSGEGRDVLNEIYSPWTGDSS